MGFRKARYDVEEKALKPDVPHRTLGEDGRLQPRSDQDESAAPVVKEEASEKEDVQMTTQEQAQGSETPKESHKETTGENSGEARNALKELADDQEASKVEEEPKKKSRSRSNKKTTSQRAKKKKSTQGVKSRSSTTKKSKSTKRSSRKTKEKET